MRTLLLLLALAPPLATGVIASRVGAQTQSPVIFQATIGGHTVSGGAIDYRTGLLLDALAAVPVRQTASRSLVVAGGGSVVYGGAGDRCLLTPSGGCAPKANFGIANVLIGFEQAVDSMPLRFLVGPAMYDGARARSVGLQGRIDLFAPIWRHTVWGIMARATVLPSHGGQSLSTWAGGFSLGLR